MFTDNMSSNELLDEYHSDLPFIQERALQFDESEYVNKHLFKRRKQSCVVITKPLKTPRGNRYLGIFIYVKNGKTKFTKQWEFSSFHIGFMNTFKGVTAIAFYADSKQALIFTPHFFRRYKERMLKICDWALRNALNEAKTIEDLVGIYVKRNLGTTWIETESEFGNKVHIFAPVNDGVALLQWNKDKQLLQANTFVTNDMLNDKQLQMVEYAKAYFRLTNEERRKYKLPDFISGDESNKK
jgi:hypothetical protein